MPTNKRTNVSLDDLNQLKQRIEKVAGYLDTVENNLLSSIETHCLRLARLGQRVNELTAAVDDHHNSLTKLARDFPEHVNNLDQHNC